MTVKLSATVRNAMLDAVETAIGASPIVRIRTGAPPASTVAADTGTVLAEITLSADWMEAATAGVKAFSGTPLQDASANATGTAGHFRVYGSDGTTVHWQGTIAGTGGGGDMALDNTSLTAGQEFAITSWTIDMNGNA